MYKRVVSIPLSLMMLSGSLSGPLSQIHAASPAEHISLTRKAAADGMVLLENNGALPLKEGTNVAMFGRAMIDYVRGGGGSGATNVDYTVNILQGMQNKAEQGKISLYQPLVDFYTEQVSTNGITNDANITVTDDMISQAAAASKTAVVTIGRYSSEGSDRTATAGDYYLSDAETDLITRVAAAFENTVVVLNVGAVLDTSWISAIDGVDAVLQSYQAGMEGGNAVADVLTGAVNPSGKTVDTYAKSYDNYPSSDTFYESSSYINYEEDIFVGYRYFETFDPNYETVNYEFGYGLSYTTFTLSDVKARISGDQIIAQATVTNTGDVAGREVVQTYFSAPQGKMGKPAKELAAFAKTDDLAPGESETVVMAFDIDDMSSFDDEGVVAESAYVLEQGDYEIFVGNSIKNAGENGSIFTYTVEEDTITEQLSTQCAPTDLTRRLNADGTYDVFKEQGSQSKVLAVSASEQTRLEMEDFSSAHSTIRIESFYDENFERQNCLAYMNAAGLWAEYTLDVEEAGEYEVILSAANGYADLSDCFHVLVDGAAQPDIHFTAAQTGDGSGASEWYNFEEQAPFSISLNEGVNQVRFVAKGQNPNYDYMKLRKIGEPKDVYNHKVPASGAKIEGESFNYSGLTTGSAVRTESFTRDGQPAVCLAYMNYDGNFVEYYLDVAQAGDYDIILNAANGRATFTFNPGIAVNGTESAASIQAVQTGDGEGKTEWYNFEDLAPVTVTLPQGKCILSLNSKGSYPNIDYMTIVPHAEGTDETVRHQESAMLLSTDQEAAPAAEKLMLLDVYNDPTLMKAFLAQISDAQLIAMLGGQPNTGPANTGGMGNLMEFGIPNAMTADGPQGIRISNHCTAWPVSTLLASTWDTDLVYQVGKAAAREAADNGIDIWLAPGMNIHRDPLCGRNFEYYSEDPLVAGKMAAAITEGCQSEDISITLKHFCVNNKETNRNSVDTRLSERALREIYLKGFEIAVKEANPWSIMTSYNYLNGIETSENRELLTNIARNEWGYQGIFMTDWGNNSNHVRELMAGNDVKMPSGSPEILQRALDNGTISRDLLEETVERLLNMIMKTNVFQTKIVNPPVVAIENETTLKAALNIINSKTVRSEATSDTDGGLNLGYCDAGGYAEYWINVATAGAYDLSARSASNAGSGAFDVLVDGEIVASFDVPNTGGWQNWTTLDPQNIELASGRHLLRVNFTESGSNLNWLKFVLTESHEVVESDKSLLAAAIEYANAKAAEDGFAKVHPIVKAKFESALAAANAVYADESAAQAEVNDAWIALCDAIHYLSFTADKSLLTEMVAQAEIVAGEIGNYDGDTDAFLAALEAAKAVLENENALDPSIEEALNNLSNAMDALTRKPDVELDLSILRMLVQVCDELDLSAYIENGKYEFTAALAGAKAVLEAPESQDQIDAAVESLHGAYLNLRLKADEGLLKDLAAFVKQVDAIDEGSYSKEQVKELKAIQKKIGEALANHAQKSPELDLEGANSLKADLERGKAILASGKQNVSAADSNNVKPSASASVKTAASTHGKLFSLLGAAAILVAAGSRRRNKK